MGSVLVYVSPKPRHYLIETKDILDKKHKDFNFVSHKISTWDPVFYRISENGENIDYMDDDDDEGSEWRSVELPQEKSKSNDYQATIELPNGDDVIEEPEEPKAP